jgi:hypothetical protein
VRRFSLFPLNHDTNSGSITSPRSRWLRSGPRPTTATDAVTSLRS